MNSMRDKGRQGTALTQNELKIMQSIVAAERATRKVISDAARVSIALVSSTLQVLEQRGIVTKESASQKKSGRPSFFYELARDFGHFLGISLEPGSFRVVIADSQLDLIYDRRFPLALSLDPHSHLNDIVDRISRQIQPIISSERIQKSPLYSMGIALPGMTEAHKGIWLRGFQVTGISNVNLRQILESRFNLPVVIEDPARAVACLEKAKGHGRGINSFVLLYLGYGVGSGIVINDGIYKGFHSLAGEIGHIAVDKDGYRCSCGAIGCLETVVSTSGILRRFIDRLHEGVLSALQKQRANNGYNLTLPLIRKAAEENDRFAISTLFEIGEFLGNACVTIIKLFDPQKIVISGYVSLLKEFFQAPIDLEIKKHIDPEMLSGFSVEFADYAPNHDAHGVALMAVEHYFNRSRLERCL